MPLIVRYPREIEPGVNRRDMVINLDYAPTFLDYAGLAAPAEMQGRSMRAVLRGRTPRDWRRSVYYHYFEYPAVHSVKRHYGVRTDRYKLIHFYYDIDAWEMYDLEKDPRELRNVYADPAYAADAAGDDGRARPPADALRGHGRSPVPAEIGRTLGRTDPDGRKSHEEQENGRDLVFPGSVWRPSRHDRRLPGPAEGDAGRPRPELRLHRAPATTRRRSSARPPRSCPRRARRPGRPASSSPSPISG